MHLDCEGCAGCCLDWRPLVADGSDHERRGRRDPMDDRYNFPQLSGREVRGFIEAGYGDALTVRLFEPDEGDDVVCVDGHDLAAIRGRPVFLVGLRVAPKPVAPFGIDPDATDENGTDATGRTWLDACVFLDPATLQCRIHGGDRYPETCSTYPGTNLHLGRETECERVEDAFGGERLLDDEPPADVSNPFDPGALGDSVFAHPSPEALEGAVDRVVAGDPRREHLIPFLTVAAGSAPGTLAVDDDRVRQAETALRDPGENAEGSWVGDALSAWTERAGEPGTPATGSWVNADRKCGAPATPGWTRNDQ
ncbi:hypothetical protein AArcSl_1718 [Halalkaliarchaeum desulfuricum]|uniref:YkgJ family cysteine cluster protein n=1 Tax=Halalkaliarchaeum desulfuricum TaxID=2055893 RepID=A0A343TJS4_9EURY|nr:YkgJ family cysteine cluster protein [Halalkaliarchaeum desulfuricum]AUX09346.1 hypothetical protein AArcSl_1718 [Halalkaliarchaeum desulfuricum]